MGKGRKVKGRPKKRGAGNRNWIYFSLTAFLVIAIGVSASVFWGRDNPTPDLVENPLPAWLSARPTTVRAAYAYAAEHPETLSYIPCFCGCGSHSGHRSTNDCFVAGRNPDGSVAAYDNHGADCDMCIDAALMTRDMLNQGKSLKEVREAVVAKYGELGPSTATPPIP